MAELVAERTDTATLAAIAVYLVQTAVVVHRLAVQLEGHTGVAQFVLMGPNGVGRTAVRFAFTGIQNNNPIDIAVVVAVILTEVCATTVVRQFAGLYYQFVRILVISVPIIGSVVRGVPAYRYRSIDVDLHVILTPTLIIEILVNRTRGAIIRIIVAHRPFGHGFIRLFESQIFIAHQDHGTARREQSIRSRILFRTTNFCFRLSTFDFRLFHFFAHRHQRLFIQPSAVFVRHVVKSLVSMQEHDFLISVGICPDHTLTACRYCYRTHCDSA